MTTNVPGDSARQFRWQVDHYFVRGGPNDPVVQTTPAVPATPTGGGTLSWNSVITLPPVPGQGPNRSMTFNSTGTLTSDQLLVNTGGIFIGTLPQGAWIQSIELMCYAALSVGTSTSVGIFYVPTPNVTVYPVATLNRLVSIVTPSAQVLYSTQTGGATTAFSSILGAPGPRGPGNPVVGINQLASLTDIDIYVASFLIAGSGTASSTGSFAAMINFTGIEG